MEDELRSRDTEEQKRNRIRDAEAEAGLDPRGLSDPYAPYRNIKNIDQVSGVMDTFFEYMQHLYDKGARNFMLIDLPPLRRTPMSTSRRADHAERSC